MYPLFVQKYIIEEEKYRFQGKIIKKYCGSIENYSNMKSRHNKSKHGKHDPKAGCKPKYKPLYRNNRLEHDNPIEVEHRYYSKLNNLEKKL